MKTFPPPPKRQLTLLFPNTPAPGEAIWETLDPATKNAALEALARILASSLLRPAAARCTGDPR